MLAAAGGCSCKLVSLFLTTRLEHPKDIPGHRNVQSSKAPSKTQHQSVHLGSRFCWLCKCDRCYFVPAESHLTVGQSGGSLWREREEGKKEKRRQLPYTWVFERSTLFASPQAVILSDLKLSRARPGLVIAQENPQAGKKGGKALE